MRLTWGTFYALFYLYRCAYSVLGQVIVLRLTSVPDTVQYQGFTVGQIAAIAAANEGLDLAMQKNANVLTQIIAALLGGATGGNPILINIGFQTLAFLGMVHLLRGVEVAPRRVLAVLFMTPSFSVWSSIASKEAIVVLLVCILMRYLVDILADRDKLRVRYLIAIVLLYVFKPHFVPAMVFAIVVSKLASYTRRPATFALACAVASVAPLVLLWHWVGETVMFYTRALYREPGLSSRGIQFLQSPEDFFLKAPEGIALSFMGPNLSELGGGPLHFVSYAESLAIVAILLAVFIVRAPRIPIYSLVVGGFTLFWILIATYPLGVFNPGTAIRYRTDYIIVVFVAVVVLMSRDTYVSWREKRRQPLSLDAGATGPLQEPA